MTAALSRLGRGLRRVRGGARVLCGASLVTVIPAPPEVPSFILWKPAPYKQRSTVKREERFRTPPPRSNRPLCSRGSQETLCERATMKFYSLPDLPPASRSRRRLRVYALAAASLLLPALPGPPARAAVQVQQLSPSAGSPQPVGATVVWSAAATDTNPGALEYRFSVRASGGAFAVVRDFSHSNSFEWTPSEREGGYDIQVAVRNASTGEAARQAASYAVSSRVSGSSPVVNGTGILWWRSTAPRPARGAPVCASGSGRRATPPQGTRRGSRACRGRA